ncbi:MAG: hypothetical protein MUF84_08175 [Anaerolineae bacterium]|jgi:hypothetical protein|nr:hypothetical protein [Anaerolineae bacterium]
MSIMVKATSRSKTISVLAGLIANALLSWTVLPLAIPPFRAYSYRELIEVLLWQGMGVVGWPLGILGGLANLSAQGNMSDFVDLLLLLIYPTALLLLMFALFSKRSKMWVLIIFHVLITFAFGIIWHRVLNGYDFMPG